MTRGGLTMTIKTLLVIRKSSSAIISPKTVVGRCMSKVARGNASFYAYDDDVHEAVEQVQSMKHKVQLREEKLQEVWIPDARTGIYYPKGHEWVMKDVPDGAASFAYSYWFRNTDT